MNGFVQPPAPVEEYRDRYVAFLDILGFSDLTVKADQHPNWRSYLINCISALKNALPTRADANQFRFVQFSDSIVISALRSPGGLSNVIYAATTLVRKMLDLNILLRGGIAAGNFHHDDNMMFGPALVRAYEFEKRGAPPHVGLHTAVIEDMKPIGLNADWTGFIALDPWDQTPMLHTFQDFGCYNGISDPTGFQVDIVAAQLAERIERHAKDMSAAPAVRAKWKWLQDYYNQTVAPADILVPSRHFDDWRLVHEQVRQRMESRYVQMIPPIPAAPNPEIALGKRLSDVL